MNTPTTHIALDVMQDAAERACAILKVLANQDRLLLLCSIAEREMAVGALEEQLGIRQPTLSQQLGILREHGLVSTRREGKSIFYSLKSTEVQALMQVLYEQFCMKSETACR